MRGEVSKHKQPTDIEVRSGGGMAQYTPLIVLGIVSVVALCVVALAIAAVVISATVFVAVCAMTFGGNVRRKN